MTKYICKLLNGVALIISITLVGCGSIKPFQSTQYQQAGVFANGWHIHDLSFDRYEVEYSTTGGSDFLSTQTYWLYRAAELTLEKGFDGFEILPATGDDLKYWIPCPNVKLHCWYDKFTGATFSVKSNIRLLKQPISKVPKQTFDARFLKAKLDPIVSGARCGATEKICKHSLDYLQ
jgi:hypothetical protein